MPVPLPLLERRAELALLERRYDGPIPAGERRLAEFGSTAASLLAAAGNAAFYRALTRHQLATIRRRRAAGTAYPALLADLRLYRRQWRLWRRTALQSPLRAQRGEGGSRREAAGG